MKTPSERAIEWLYPDDVPNPAALRRDIGVEALERKFKKAMDESRCTTLSEAYEILQAVKHDHGDTEGLWNILEVAQGRIQILLYGKP